MAGVREIGRLVAAGLLLAAVLPATACGGERGEFTGRVVAVADGDTLRVLRSGREVKVRLHAVDAPERGQPFGDRARRFTSERVFGRTVTVRVVELDDYGRMVGEVLLPGERSLNRDLVEAGMAWWYRHYAPKDALLERLEKEARGARRGLWADRDPLPPWEWRREGAGGAAPGHSSGKGAPAGKP